MERSVSVFEAKTHFSGLVKDVIEKHQAFTITKHGHPVAKLIPATEEAPVDTLDTIAKIKALGKEIGKTGLTLKEIKAMRDEGRR